MTKEFFAPTIVYQKKHVSGLWELGVALERTVHYFVLPGKTTKKELEMEDLEKLKTAPIIVRPMFGDDCACCGTEADVIDRGVPLCFFHNEEQIKLIKKRPKLFVRQVKYNRNSVESILFS